jgi:hypothetical protein
LIYYHKRPQPVKPKNPVFSQPNLKILFLFYVFGLSAVGYRDGTIDPDFFLTDRSIYAKQVYLSN